MRVFLRILPTLALVLALFTPARVARAAPPAEAAAAFDEGIGHYRRKAFTEAAEAFHRAYRIQPSADAAYNAGLAWELSGRLGLAATAYQVALELELEPTAAADARARIERMAKDLCRVEVSGPEGTRVRLAPLDVDAHRAVLYLEAGRQTLRITLPSGARRTRDVDAVAGTTSVLLIEDTARRDPGARKVSSPRPEPKPESTGTGYRIAGFVSLGVAVVAAGTAGVLGLRALSARDEYDASGHRDREARDRAARLRTGANIAWAVAGVTGAGGAALLLFGPSDATGSARLPAGVAFGGRF